MEAEELSGLENLEELWLGKNKIERIEGLGKVGALMLAVCVVFLLEVFYICILSFFVLTIHSLVPYQLTKLRRLDVQSNRLTKIENLTSQVDTLEELYLAHNGIDVEGASCETGLALPFTQLNTIDLSRNRLTNTTPFAHLKSLTDLWISGNEIKTFEEVEPLTALTELDGVYLEYNPVASEFEYRKKLAEMIPSLTQIDANMIGGLGQHGYVSAGGGGVGGSGGNLVERMRQLQDAVIQKAAEETQGAEK